MSAEPQTLYDRIGGREGAAALVDEFYVRVLNDSRLRPFFLNSSIERLKRIQQEFFAAALDGPVATSDVDLARIHQGRNIRREHLTRFVDHLIAVLDSRDAITAADAMNITFRIGTYAGQVLEESGGEDG